MAITQTSILELQYSRELVTLTDGFGMQRKLYIHASQVANRATIIATKVAEMETNEANVTALRAAYNAAQSPATVPSAAPVVVSVAAKAAPAATPVVATSSAAAVASAVKA